MDYEPEVIEQEATIKHQMEETRSSLADKLESLEQHVLGTVQDTTSAVTGTVDNVKESVEGTVESVRETVESVKDTIMETVENVKETVKEALDLRLQTERHPWAVVGGSVALGFAAGYLLPRLQERPGLAAETNGYEANLARSRQARSEPVSERPSIFSQLLPLITEAVGPEIERLKSYATEAFKGMVHDFVAKSVPGYEKSDQPPFQGNAFPRQGGLGDEPMHSQ
jgi:ElaB/YqjD/DUF883 family membrane-anchored ribosome-binding protein